MLSVVRVREKYVPQLGAVCHEDGTARIQTVRQETDSFLHELLTAFGRKTGVPVLLNTSFNLRRSPIVESPTDALECFAAMSLNTMVLGPYIVEKHSPWARRSLKGI